MKIRRRYQMMSEGHCMNSMNSISIVQSPPRTIQHLSAKPHERNLYHLQDSLFQSIFLFLLDKKVTKRLRNVYRDSVSVVVVNNIHGKAVYNVRLSLRQGDLPSMHLFSYGIDPLLTFLNKRLKGILICSLPVHGGHSLWLHDHI